MSIEWRDTQPKPVSFTFKSDRYDNEGNETFTLRLSSSAVPQGGGIFFIQDLRLTIQDGNGMNICSLVLTQFFSSLKFCNTLHDYNKYVL